MKTIMIASVLLLGMLNAKADGHTNELVASNPSLTSTNQINTLNGGLSRTYVLPQEIQTIQTVRRGYGSMKPARIFQGTNNGPQTLQEAGEHILNNVALTSPPQTCFEYEGVYYFSFYGSTNFTSGLAIKRGSPTIYSWKALSGGLSSSTNAPPKSEK